MNGNPWFEWPKYRSGLRDYGEFDDRPPCPTCGQRRPGEGGGPGQNAANTPGPPRRVLNRA